jgi:hypothetical protein
MAKSTWADMHISAEAIEKARAYLQTQDLQSPHPVQFTTVSTGTESTWVYNNDYGSAPGSGAHTGLGALFYDPATGGVMQAQPSFQQSATSPTQASQLESRLTAIILELEELESSMQEIAKLVEAGLESYTLMRRHISNLRRDANPLGTMPQAPKKKPQRYSLSPGQVHFANQPADLPTVQSVEVGEGQAGLVPSPPDQE